MSKYWSKLANSIEPYVPGEQPKDRKYIKLNTNENPYPPSPKVLEAIKNTANDNLKLYPEPTCIKLRETIAEYYNIKKEQVFAGNGSDEVLAFSFMAFFDPGKPILYPDITYTFYPVYSSLYKIDYSLVPLNDDFSIPVDKFLTENGGIIFPNPNAPTGKYMDLKDIRRILDYNKESVVIIDEAYVGFGGESAVSLINEYPNLLVIHTLSKARSLAGLRVGFAMGHEDLIQAIDNIKNSINSYTIDSLAMAGAIAAISDREYFEDTRNKVMATRERVAAELKGLGFKVVDSKSNFLFISHEACKAVDIFSKLREKCILVRYFKLPRIDNFLRVSIGTDEEMNSFLQAVKDIVL